MSYIRPPKNSKLKFYKFYAQLGFSAIGILFSCLIVFLGQDPEHIFAGAIFSTIALWAPSPLDQD